MVLGSLSFAAGRPTLPRAVVYLLRARSICDTKTFKTLLALIRSVDPQLPPTPAELDRFVARANKILAKYPTVRQQLDVFLPRDHRGRFVLKPRDNGTLSNDTANTTDTADTANTADKIATTTAPVTPQKIMPATTPQPPHF